MQWERKTIFSAFFVLAALVAFLAAERAQAHFAPRPTAQPARAELCPDPCLVNPEHTAKKRIREIFSAHGIRIGQQHTFVVLLQRVNPTLDKKNASGVANELNQYTQIDEGATTTTPSYDADGNMTNDTRFVYVFNAENRLIEAKPADPANAQGLARLEMAYDYAGRRISKKVYQGQQGNWTLDRTHQFHYDGWNLIKEVTSGSRNSTNEYIWGLDVSGSMQGAGGVGGLLAVIVNGIRHEVLSDLNGNVISFVKLGEITEEVCHFEYDPYGRLLDNSVVDPDVCPFMFSTKYYDEETGLYYYGFRYLSIEQGRWVNRDPLGEAGGVNLYSFVYNYPIGAVDAVGLSHWVVNGETPNWALDDVEYHGLPFVIVQLNSRPQKIGHLTLMSTGNDDKRVLGVWIDNLGVTVPYGHCGTEFEGWIQENIADIDKLTMKEAYQNVGGPDPVGDYMTARALMDEAVLNENLPTEHRIAYTMLATGIVVLMVVDIVDWIVPDPTDAAQGWARNQASYGYSW